MGTPKEIEKLLDAGLYDYLCLFDVPKERHTGFTWKVVMPYGFLACKFQDPDTKLCLLHDLSLKPLEGRLAHCDDEKHIRLVPERNNRDVIEELWDSDEGREIVQRFVHTR